MFAMQSAGKSDEWLVESICGATVKNILVSGSLLCRV